MSFDFFYDVFLLNFSLEAAKCIFQRFSVLKSYLSQTINTPISDWNSEIAITTLLTPFLPMNRAQVKDIFGRVVSRPDLAAASPSRAWTERSDESANAGPKAGARIEPAQSIRMIISSPGLDPSSSLCYGQPRDLVRWPRHTENAHG